MAATVTVKVASYRNNPIKNVTLPLLRDFKLRAGSKKGEGTVTVDGTSLGFGDKIRIRVRHTDFKVEGTIDQPIENENDAFDGAVQTLADAPLQGDFNGETEAQAIARINTRFEILDEISCAISDGSVRSVIVSGPPGVGKSHGVEETLTACFPQQLLGGEICFEIFKGSISPVGLYMKLHEFSNAGKVLVFDDSDECLLDPISLGLLKSALDTSKRRWISWAKESYALKDASVPSRFEFKGSIIFISNLDFANCRSKLLKPHLDALMSRSHYLDLGIGNLRDKFLRIKSVVQESSLMDDYNFSDEVRQEIMDYVTDNITKLQELSLRTIIKISDLVKMKQHLPRGKSWQEIANVTLLKHKRTF